MVTQIKSTLNDILQSLSALDLVLLRTTPKNCPNFPALFGTVIGAEVEVKLLPDAPALLTFGTTVRLRKTTHLFCYRKCSAFKNLIWT